MAQTFSYKINHEDIIYSIGNIVIITALWTYHAGHFTGFTNVESLGCIPETNIILHANYIRLKKKKKLEGAESFLTKLLNNF